MEERQDNKYKIKKLLKVFFRSFVIINPDTIPPIRNTAIRNTTV